MVSHVDQTEHDVQVIITEQGIADLRWKTPRERAELHHRKLRATRTTGPCCCGLLRAPRSNVAAGKHTPHDGPGAVLARRLLATGTMTLPEQAGAQTKEEDMNKEQST